MHPSDSGEPSDRPPYLRSAPSSLIERYEERIAFPGREILGRLLTDQQMLRAWTELKKPIQAAEELPHEWWRLWKEIELAIRDAREITTSRTRGKPRREKQREFQSVANRADKLARSLNEGPLDLRAYEFFPREVMQIFDVPDWSSLNGVQRATAADRLLSEWPTIAELLTELASRARSLARDEPLPTRRTRDAELRHFASSLCAYLNRKYSVSLYGTVARIASVVFEQEVTKPLVERAAKGSL